MDFPQFDSDGLGRETVFRRRESQPLGQRPRLGLGRTTPETSLYRPPPTFRHCSSPQTADPFYSALVLAFLQNHAQIFKVFVFRTEIQIYSQIARTQPLSLCAGPKLCVTRTKKNKRSSFDMSNLRTIPFLEVNFRFGFPNPSIHSRSFDHTSVPPAASFSDPLLPFR